MDRDSDLPQPGLPAEPGGDCAGDPQPLDNQLVRLIDDARGGSKQAMDVLFSKYRGYLLRAANNRMGGDLRAHTRASDIVQNTFMTAQTRFERFQGRTERELLAWLCGILKNHVRDQAKYHRRQKRDTGRAQSLNGDLEVLASARLVVDDRETPASVFARDEEARRLADAVARLSREHRQVLGLHNWECLTLEEVGKRMGRSADAARKLWGRALDRLRENLERSDGADASGSS